MECTWAFCRGLDTGERKDLLGRCLASALPGKEFEPIENPDDFLLDEDLKRGDGEKRHWRQIPYYLARRSPWIGFTYASGGEPFELSEPAAVSKAGDIPVVQLSLSPLGELSLTVFAAGEVLVQLDGEGFRDNDGELAEKAALSLVRGAFDDLADASAADDAITSLTRCLGLLDPDEEMLYFEPEDAYSEGTIIAFRSR